MSGERKKCDACKQTGGEGETRDGGWIHVSVNECARALRHALTASEAEVARLTELIAQMHSAIGGRDSHGGPEPDAECVIDAIHSVMEASKANSAAEGAAVERAEAAEAEVARLREEVAPDESGFPTWREIAAAEAQAAEALRADVARLTTERDGEMLTAWMDRATRSEAEVARLRGQVDKARVSVCPFCGAHGEYVAQACRDCCKEMDNDNGNAALRAIADRDAARSEAEALRADVARLTTERDEARASAGNAWNDMDNMRRERNEAWAALAQIVVVANGAMASAILGDGVKESGR